MDKIVSGRQMWKRKITFATKTLESCGLHIEPKAYTYEGSEMKKRNEDTERRERNVTAKFRLHVKRIEGEGM